MADLISPPISPNLCAHFAGPQSAALSSALGVDSSPLESADVAVFTVSANSAFDESVLTEWAVAREHYIPSLVAVVDLEKSDLDIEEMSAIIGKTLDPVVTPYLVLHADDGTPTALIELTTQTITDYSHGSAQQLPSEPEHQALIQEFRNEYLEQIEMMGDDAFTQGLLFPALPVFVEGRMGLIELAEYLRQIPGSS